jgi:glycosyltransferase involved in cell wall biosynthesis
MNYTNKPKIISIMPHGPAYHYSFDGKPDIYWEKPDGSLVGFWPREWLDFLGEAVLKVTNRYEWEVWQPDYRADRIYSKTIETGVTHRLFPAEEKFYRPGIKSQKGIFSKPMISRLKKLENSNIILMLYSTYGFRTPFYNEILKIFGSSRRFPVFFRSGGMFKAPISEVLEVHRPLTYLDLIVEHIRLKKLVHYVDVISEQSESALREVRKVYNGRIERLTMGCDFNFWVSVPSMELKRSVRNKLNIPHEKTVFFASGNFVPRKQLDKLLEVLSLMQDRDNFFLIIAGQGDETYTNKLTSLAEPLVRQRKAILHHFVTGIELRDIYWASDVYVSVATDEGGPVSVMKAMACGLPVLSTPVGETAGRMKKYGVGKFVPVTKYDEWAKAIIEILNKKMPSILDIKIARDAYDWPNVAKRFVSVYDDLIKADIDG